MGAVYHVFNRSIAKFKIFNNKAEYERMRRALVYYQVPGPRTPLSKTLRETKKNKSPAKNNRNHSGRSALVNLVAYCLMPTHFHFILEENKKNGLPAYLNNVLNSYTRFFNLRHNRIGPLWQGPSKKVPVTDDEQLVHLSRYVHLNPVTAYLVDYPEQWKYSSYHEYLGTETGEKLCRFTHLMDIEPARYRQFVLDQVGYQRELSRLKDVIFE